MFQLCMKKIFVCLFQVLPLPPFGDIIKACPWNVKYKWQQGEDLDEEIVSKCKQKLFLL